MSCGHNRRLIHDKDWEVSAIQDALFGIRDIDMTGAVVFSTCFPDFEDIKLIYATGIKTIYFFGDPDDKKTVEFLNSLPNPLEMIRLKS